MSAQVSGRVYHLGTAELGEPNLVDVLITIDSADSSRRTTVTNATGFYSLSASAGIVSISAAKSGFQTNRSTFELSRDTVLNFSLIPVLPE
jgi:hypothetical protein